MARKKEFEIMKSGKVHVGRIGGEQARRLVLRRVVGERITHQWPDLPLRPKATSGEIEAVLILWLRMVQVDLRDKKRLPSYIRRQLYRGYYSPAAETARMTTP